MQQEETSLSGNRDAHFIGQLQPAATFEALLSQKHLYVPEKLGLVAPGEPAKKWNIPLDRVEQAFESD